MQDTAILDNLQKYEIHTLRLIKQDEKFYITNRAKEFFIECFKVSVGNRKVQAYQPPINHYLAFFMFNNKTFSARRFEGGEIATIMRID